MMHTTKTTIHLSLPQAARWLDRLAIAPAFLIAILVVVVAGAISGVDHLRGAAAATAVPTPALPRAPLIVIQKEAPPLPTAQPAAPTPDQQLRQEVELLRQRVAELEQQQAAPPAVDQVAPAAAAVEVEAVPTPAAPPPTLAPQQLVILDRQQWAIQAQKANR